MPCKLSTPAAAASNIGRPCWHTRLGTHRLPSGAHSMYRTIWLVKRKPGLTPQQFREHYETRHRPLGERLINGYGLSYERYYLYPMSSDGAEPIYDAVMQLCFP